MSTTLMCCKDKGYLQAWIDTLIGGESCVMFQGVQLSPMRKVVSDFVGICFSSISAHIGLL